MVDPRPGDVVESAGRELRVQSRDRGRVFVFDVGADRRGWIWLGQWQGLALRGGRVLARGTKYHGGPLDNPTRIQ